MSDNEYLEGELPQDEAFIAAKTGFNLFGQELVPYSPSRKVAAQRMGLLYPFVGEAGAAQMEATGMYPGALSDTIIVLWLCTLKDAIDLTKDEVKAGAWTPTKAYMKPELAMEQALAWASAAGFIDTNTDKFQAAFQTFMAIVSGVSASEFRIEVGDNGGEQPADSDTKV